ncbi:LysE family translocator [Thalassotalea euphylliae]|uniref:LysE family translocator n=1 Tax=Thalassotalea euphylliae TaxID=1655234 RepID=A0A3E0TRD5_9GAMM|nr:LysE family translocator [Thalassotalea euphylliae]REL27129.1 LysE family translocator [Thalassotalea euphylliae]
MFDSTLLAVFVPTIFFVSITPGMCMTLAMSLGMSIGVRRTLFMMFGELLGVASVATAAVMGVAAVMLHYPAIFTVLKTIGGIYLAYIGFKMWRSTGKFAINAEQHVNRQPLQLFSQGFVTAIANPKGWAFMVSLLPPFINQSMPLAPQLSILVAVILLSEFICMMLYATGGKTIGKLLTSRNNLNLLNKISGGLMFFVALWLFIGSS